MLLLHHPEFLQRVLEEQKQVLGKPILASHPSHSVALCSPCPFTDISFQYILSSKYFIALMLSSLICLGTDSPSTPLDYDAVGNMEFLQNCVKESLRLFPPLIMLMRMAMQDIPTCLNGKTYIIPKGMQFIIV